MSSATTVQLLREEVPDPEAAYGAVFTKRWVVELILDLSAYRADRPLADLVAIEPACGDGSFLVAMTERLSDACKREGRSLADCENSLRAYDLQPKHVESSRRAIEQTLLHRGWDEDEALSFSTRSVDVGDFILEHDALPRADFVIGNPPYIRLESIPFARSNSYREICATMSGRADVYIGFFEVGLEALKDNGVLGFICADRWMRNQYGRRLRQLITEAFSMETVIEMHDVDAFDSNVSAYPSITVLRRAQQAPALVAQTSRDFRAAHSKLLSRWQSHAAADRELIEDSFEASVLPRWFAGQQSWPWGRPDQLRIVKDLEERFPSLEDELTGTRVGIGVATGADNVFITSERVDIETGQLIPLAMVDDISTGTLTWSGHHLISPWRPDEGGLVDLDHYPKLKAYYESCAARLIARNVAKRQPKHWFRTIDRVNHRLLEQDKLLIPDIKAFIHPVLDRGGTYPHHNLYFVTSKQWDLEVLGGLLLSRVAQLFIETYAVRMRGRYFRFQAQYLRRIRVPVIDDLRVSDANLLKKAFRERDSEAATQAAQHIYGVELPN